MLDHLYDDKLAGEIYSEKYKTKKIELNSQIAELDKRLATIDLSLARQLEQRLVLLELSQKASIIYQKRIITKFFDTITYKGSVLSVTYTKFAKVILDNVLETKKIIGDVK